MPAVEKSLIEHLAGTSRIDGTPESKPRWADEVLNMERLAEGTECTLIETGSPIGMRMASLAREAGITDDLPTLVTRITSSEEGMMRMTKFIRHHMIRRSPINPRGGFEGPKLTGHETFFIAKPIFGHHVDNPNAIAVTIALEGLALRKGLPGKIPELLQLITSQSDEHEYDAVPLQSFIHELLNRDDNETIRRLQSRGFQQLPLGELQTINSNLGATLAAEHALMSHGEKKPGEPEYAPTEYNATDYRERLLQEIRLLPPVLQRIYYFERGEDIRMLYAVPKLYEQIAALKAPNIGKMADLARELDLPIQQEYLGILYELMKLSSRGIEPVTRYILEYKQ